MQNALGFVTCSMQQLFLLLCLMLCQISSEKNLHTRKNGKRLSGGYTVGAGKQQAGVPLLTCPDPYWALPAFFCPSTGVGIPAPALCNPYSATTQRYYLMLMLETNEGPQMDWDFQ